MIVKKIIKVQGTFAKVGKGKDIEDGDIIEILNEGENTEGKFGPQDIFKIRTKNGDELLKEFNQTSKNNFIDSFGENTVDWIGKKAIVWVVKQPVQGKLKDVAYMAPEGWTMSEDGSFVAPDGHKPGEDEIKTEDIPF